jgi:HAD superfamily hydrolase (TIGR01509 family)
MSLEGTTAVNGSIDLVIFDCDGVLVDSEILAIAVDQRVLAEFGWHLPTEEIVDRFMGKSAKSFTAELEAHLGHRLPDDWDAPYAPWYHEAFETSLTPIAGIEAALASITVQTCVASSGTHAKIQKTLGLTGLLQHFEGRIFSATEVSEGKPAPDLFLHAAARMGVRPERCVVIEDSKYGARAEWLAAEGATVFSSMHNLPELLRSHAP